MRAIGPSLISGDGVSVHPTGTGYHADGLPYMLMEPSWTMGRQWICSVAMSLNQTHCPFLIRNTSGTVSCDMTVMSSNIGSSRPS